MGLTDNHIDWMRKRIWLTADDIQGVQYDDATILKTAGTTQQEKVAGFSAFEMAAGELIYGYIPVPYDVDPRHELGFRVVWSADPTDASCSVTWLLLVDTVKKGFAYSAATTALDTVIAANAYDNEGAAAAGAADDKIQVTSRGIKNSLGLTREQIETLAFLTFSIESDAVTGCDGNVCRFMGIFMDYMPMLCVGPGNEVDGSLSYTGA